MDFVCVCNTPCPQTHVAHVDMSLSGLAQKDMIDNHSQPVLPMASGQIVRLLDTCSTESILKMTLKSPSHMPGQLSS